CGCTRHVDCGRSRAAAVRPCHVARQRRQRGAHPPRGAATGRAGNLDRRSTNRVGDARRRTIRPVNILVLENDLPSTRGGQELSLLDVCRGLAARGHRITLAYVTGGDLLAEYERICEQMVRVSTYSIDRSRTVSSMLDLLESLWAVRSAAPSVVYANQYL